MTVLHLVDNSRAVPRQTRESTYAADFDLSVQALIRFYRAKGALPWDFIQVLEKLTKEQRQLECDGA